MSGVSSSSSTSATPYGTNVPPISFPGIASGIDYNSIISKYTQLTLAQETPLQTQVTSLNKQNAELLKIQNLINQFQDTFAAVSNSALFNATAPTSSNSTAVAATTVANGTATPGTYTITKATLATATQIKNDTAANGTFNSSAPLVNAGSSITPNNGAAGYTGKGQVTIDGVAVQYDVNSDTLTTVISRANAALTAAGITASLTDNGNGTVTVSSAQPLTLGSASDSGNLLSVLRLDTAQITQVGGNYVATSSANIGGINAGATFNTDQNAGFATAVTSGVFSINGVHFTVDSTTQNVNDLINQINGSAAGVLASFDSGNDRIVLTSKSAGPQGISLGASGDTSNFLQAAGFLTNYAQPNQISAGASEVVGQSASVTYQDTSGSTNTIYSNSNTITNAIAGVQLTLNQAVTAAAPVTVTVAQDSSAIQTGIGKFVTAYNAVIDEINSATQAPVIGTTTDDSTGSTTGTQLTTGGVLFNNQDVLSLRDRLVNLVSNYATNTGSTSYNSLASIGLQLDNSFTVDAADSSNASNTTTQTTVATKSYAGTSGKLQALNVSTFTTALGTNPNAVSALFTGTASLVGQLGAYLTGVSGLPTQLTGGIAGSVPTNSLFNTLTAQTSDQITSLQQQIKLVTDQANLQADQLRAEFVASESTIAQLQAVQGSLGALTGSGSTK
ncbi:MAG TPA: flagellar filament capping protein FliD [Candidatus Elarobacter sp.]|jgi:flagellar hook-associated protein 2